MEEFSFTQMAFAFLAHSSSIAPGMSYGFSSVVLPSLTSRENPAKLDQNQASWIASVTMMVIPFGSIVTGPFLDKFGRKKALLWINLLSVISWGVLIAAYHLRGYQYELLLLGRAATGFTAGMATVPAAVYVAEITTPFMRDLLMFLAAVFYSIGIVIVYILGYIFKDDWGSICCVILIFPCVFFPLTWIFLPESPTWLVSKNKTPTAKINMSIIRRVAESSPTINSEIQSLLDHKDKKKTIEERESNPKTKCNSAILIPFGILFGYFFFQQVCGLFVIIFYAVSFTIEAGVEIDPYLAMVIIGITRLLSSILTGIVSKKFGRRPLSIFSGLGVSSCMIALAVFTYSGENGLLEKSAKLALAWVPVALLLTFVVTGTVGFLVVPFAMVPEVFPTEMRGKVTGLMSFISFMIGFFVLKMYPSMLVLMGKAGIFLFYGGMALMGTVFVWVFLPETKGKTLREIENNFRK